MADNRTLGTINEQLAVTELENRGYTVLKCNYRCRQGEIDIIAREDIYLVFIEVKYRKNNHKGYPQESVDHRKQRRICRAALFYLWEHKMPENTPCRFDVVAILGSDITVIKDAFSCS